MLLLILLFRLFSLPAQTVGSLQKHPITYANKVLTPAAIQTAINQAPANKKVLLAPGTYRLTGKLLIRDKKGLTLDGSGKVTLTGNLNTFILLSGQINALRITGIRFVSTVKRVDKTRVESMITTDQTIQGDGYELDHCYFTAPMGNFNAIGWVPVDGRAHQPTNTRVFRHINIHHNTIERMGSCGIELLNQNLDVYRVRGITIQDNTIRNCGQQDEYGMGISLSGAMDGVNVSRNTVSQCKPYGIEIINCRNVTVQANTIRSTWAGVVGISINANADDNGHRVSNDHYSVVSNTITVRFSPIQATDVSGMTITGNVLSNLNSSDLSNGANRLVRCRTGVFARNKALSSSYNCLTLDNSSGWQIYDNTLSNKLMATGNNAYQLIWLYGSGSRGNQIHDNRYEKNHALTDTQKFVWESDGASGNGIRQ